MNSKSIIESLLYVSGNDGIDTSDIKKVTGVAADEIRNIIKQLKKAYDENPDCG
jgi:chromosome segregation and condensation protein ScpB